MLRHDILESAAYRSLSPPARAVYVEVMHRFNGMNNGKIPLSCREAAVLCRISAGTAAGAFHELVARGLIRVGRDAGFNVKTRMAREWILTHEAIDGKTAPTNEWRDWQPEVGKRHGNPDLSPAVASRNRFNAQEAKCSG